MVVEKVPVPLDTQVAWLEERLRCREEQVQRLEDVQQKSRPKSKDFWDIVQIFSGWLTPLTLAFVGFYINSTLQKPQLELSNAKEIQGLLAKLDDPNVTKNDADAAAITMATFGTYSIGPLISVLQTGGDVRVPAAEKGLRIVGITNPEPACDRLVGVLNNRTQLFTWMTHKSVIRLLGDLNCQSSRSGLGSYRTLIQQAKTPDGLVHYQRAVRVDASAPLDIDVLIQELETTQEKLDNAKSP
jgi:hypothetical protein